MSDPRGTSDDRRRDCDHLGVGASAARRRDCDAQLIASAEAAALERAQAEAAAAPAVDQAFVASHLSSLAASLRVVHDPHARMLLRAGEYQSALRDLGSRTEADRLGLARTAMALRDAIFASDEASDDEAAALADEPPFEPSQADLANGEHLRDTVDGYEAATEALLDQDTRMRLPDYTRPITAPRDHDPVGDDDDDHESEGGGHASH